MDNMDCKIEKKNSMADILPFVINQHILSFLKINETSQFARICKEFYQINVNLIKLNCFESPTLTIESFVEMSRTTTFKDQGPDYGLRFRKCKDQ